MTTQQAAEARAAEVLNRHYSTDERDDNGWPMCSCGHRLGLHETWPEHVAAELARAGVLAVGEVDDVTVQHVADGLGHLPGCTLDDYRRIARNALHALNTPPTTEAGQ